MSKYPSARLSCLLCLLLFPAALAAAPFEFKDGDRVALIGSTIIERDQTHNFFETMITGRFPDRKILFRNMGWSGDTVSVNVRAGSGPNHGVAGIKTVVSEFKPTVIIIGYGMNESYRGEPGLAEFVNGYNALLDALSGPGIRFLLLSPNYHEDLGRPLPDPTAHNEQLRKYAAAIRQIAAARTASFIDLFSITEAYAKAKTGKPLTENGIHLSAHGYWQLGRIMEAELGLGERIWGMDVTIKDEKVAGYSTDVSSITGRKKAGTGLSWKARDQRLPEPLSPTAEGGRWIRVTGLEPGNYSLSISGQVVAVKSASEWASAAMITKGPDFEQVEKLREMINKKNIQFFNRYRPQNDMYIFFGRKHEQGQNAKEIPQFDKFIADWEEKISTLKKPVEREYVLERQ